MRVSVDSWCPARTMVPRRPRLPPTRLILHRSFIKWRKMFITNRFRSPPSRPRRHCIIGMHQGIPAVSHFVAILSQVLDKASPSLDVAAEAYAKVGIVQCDAGNTCFTYKYSFNVVRPITYIRNVMGHPTWNALFNTPGHPEFPSAHSTISSAVAEALTSVFGDNFAFTINSYAYLGFPARNYSSFREMSKEMSDSRVLGGIHYQPSCDKGRELGKKVAENVLAKVQF